MTEGFARRRLLGVLSGGLPAQCLYALAKLGVPDLLAAGPRTVTWLAAECGANPHALHRLLRGLAAFGLLRQEGADSYALTSASELLRSDVPGSLLRTAILHGEEVHRSFTEITHTVHTGRPAFEKVYGLPFYDYLVEHPDLAATFAGAMGSEPVPVALGGADLSEVDTIVDVGGGDGGLLAEVLMAYPGMRGVLLDLPESVRAAEVRLAALGDRVDLVEGSFFDRVPPGGDAYVLARVLHNWADGNAELILRRVAAAMRPGARLLVLEKILPREAGSAATAMVDLLMLGLLEGHDRTEGEYVALLDKAGFTVVEVRPAAGVAEALIEAVAR